MTRRFLTFIGALALAATAACGGTSRNATPLVENIDEITRATSEGDFEAIVARGSAHWENRDDLAELQLAIADWEEAIAVPTPEGVDRNAALFPVYVSLSRAYYFMADAHLRWDPSADIADAHSHGMAYGERAIALGNEDWTHALLYETPVPEAVSTLTTADIPAVYWYATNAGRWAGEVSIAELLARKDDIYAMIDRIRQLDPSFYHGAQHRYFGVYYTKIPFGNPDLAQSRQNFETAMAQYPEYLDNYFLFADEYCRVAGLRDEAVEALNHVLAYDVDSYPPLRPENLASQRKAQHLLDNLDEYFN